MAGGKKTNTVSIASQLAEPVLQELGLKLWDIRFEKVGSIWFLRYFLEKDGGITIEDCENFSRRISKLLDEADPIDQSYYLEVSSPGVERELVKDWHFQEYIGQDVNVRLIRPVEGMRDFTGRLLSLEGDVITILLEGEEEDLEMSFTRSEAAYVRLVDHFDYSSAQLPEEE